MVLYRTKWQSFIPIPSLKNSRMVPDRWAFHGRLLTSEGLWQHQPRPVQKLKDGRVVGMVEAVRVNRMQRTVSEPRIRIVFFHDPTYNVYIL
jgi:hypothetical protein